MCYRSKFTCDGEDSDDDDDDDNDGGNADENNDGDCIHRGKSKTLYDLRPPPSFSV